MKKQEPPEGERNCLNCGHYRIRRWLECGLFNVEFKPSQFDGGAIPGPCEKWKWGKEQNREEAK